MQVFFSSKSSLPNPHFIRSFGDRRFPAMADEKPPVVAEKTLHPTSLCNTTSISRTLRSIQPAHYLFKVESLSVLLNTDIEKYESGSFEVGGYKWSLCIYPNGNKKSDGEGHISLYLEISEAQNLPLGWEVTVNFKLFVFNHIHEKYLTVQDADGKVRHFNAMKTRCGFAQFLSLDVLKDPRNGYLMDDSCIFGAEVFVIKYSGKGESLSMIKDPVDGTFTWTIENFSALNQEVLDSEIFTVKELKWRLVLYPKGNNKAKNKSLSLFLELTNRETLHQRKLYTAFELLIKDQCNDEIVMPSHVKSNAKVWFRDTIENWGFPNMAQLLIVIHPTVQTASMENVFTIGQPPDLFSYLEVVQTYDALPSQTASPNFITRKISRIRTADTSWYSDTCSTPSAVFFPSKSTLPTHFIQSFGDQRFPAMADEKPPVVAEKTLHPTSICNSTTSISRTLRSIKPAHYLFRVESVSVLLNTDIEKYESGSFKVGGYRWRLCLYPNGNKKSGGEDHISLYLEISDAQKLPVGWEVTVNFKLFVFNHIHEKYLTVQDADGKVRDFNVMKSRCGFAQFLSLDVLKDPCNGYLMDDSCIFGAEVFVIKYSGKGECLSMIKDPDDGTFTWVIENFSTLNEEVLYSETFTIKEIKWKLSLYPKGNGKVKNKSLCLFLELADCETLHHQRKLYMEFELLIKDQCNDENVEPSHVKSNAKVWFCDSNKEWGFADMVSLSDLNDKSKDFLLNDSLIVEAKILLMMHSKNI
eukprot:XP_019074395.1 PREDICTED: uncharacterized protein LOC100259955 [Vitis vinifera]